VRAYDNKKSKSRNSKKLTIASLKRLQLCISKRSQRRSAWRERQLKEREREKAIRAEEAAERRRQREAEKQAATAAKSL
tara:strand:+ start:5758 stop:5994 length:237 start_codon:yes stop_codon:yes gene_type:complete